MTKPKLFSHVRCRAYLKKETDGVHIVLYNPDGSFIDGKYVDSPQDFVEAFVFILLVIGYFMAVIAEQEHRRHGGE